MPGRTGASEGSSRAAGGGDSEPGRSWFGVILLVLLAASSGLAYLWPQIAGTAFDPFRLSPNLLWLLVSVTMFCLGTSVNWTELRQLRESPVNVFAGLVAQCVFMPLLAWAIARSMGLDAELSAGIILVGCVPGAMASNVLTMTARGNVSYSVSLTTIATLASPVTVPVLLWLLVGSEEGGNNFDPAKTSYQLLCSVVLPVVVGFAAKELSGVIRRTAQLLAPSLASIALLWIIASVVSGSREQLGSLTPGLLIGLLCLNLFGYAAGWVMGKLRRMPVNMSRALILEVGMQNAGVGTTLAATLYGSQSPAQIPTAAYTFGCMLTGTILAAYWSSRGASASLRSDEQLD